MKSQLLPTSPDYMDIVILKKISGTYCELDYEVGPTMESQLVDELRLILR